MKEFLKERVVGPLRWSVRFCVPMLVFLVVSALDSILQIETRTQIEDFFSHPFLDGFYMLLRVVKVGSLLGSLAFLLGRWARVVYLPLWLWICVVETVEVFARIFYNMSLDGDWLMIVLASSREEMGEFFSGLGMGAIGLGCLGFFTALLGGGALLWRTAYPTVAKRTVLFGLAMILPFFVGNVLLRSPLLAFHDMMFTFLPMDTVRNLKTYSDIGQIASKPDLPQGLHCGVSGPDRPLGLFVIGESATCAHWHLYGYERPTTPMLDGLREQLVIFEDVTATHPTTGRALRMLLTEATVEAPDRTKCTFSQELSAVGYHPALISAQSRWGRWEGVETLLFSGCERKVYLGEQTHDTNREEGPFDGDLLPILDEVLMTKNAPDMVFLHLLGSHVLPFYRYPMKRAVYPRYEGDAAPGVAADDERMQVRVNTYDNSIVYTDYLLGELVQRLSARKGVSFLVYLSDHGETPKSNSWRDQSCPDLRRVPFVVWFSPEYRQKFPEIVRNIEEMSKSPLRLDRAKTVLRQLAGLSL